nr:hypothetical protein [Ensifer sp. NM-2]
MAGFTAETGRLQLPAPAVRNLYDLHADGGLGFVENDLTSANDRAIDLEVDRVSKICIEIYVIIPMQLGKLGHSQPAAAKDYLDDKRDALHGMFANRGAFQRNRAGFDLRHAIVKSFVHHHAPPKNTGLQVLNERVAPVHHDRQWHRGGQGPCAFRER